jgi:hypothetical protein
MRRSFLPASALVAVLLLAGCATKADGSAKVIAASRVGLPAVPASLARRCPPPSRHIAGKDYRVLFADALVWGNCADKKQRDWIGFYSGLRRDFGGR